MKNTKKLVLVITSLLVSSMFVGAASGLLTANELFTRGSSTVLPISQAIDPDFETLMGGGFIVTTDGGGSGEGWDAIAGDDAPVGIPDADVGGMSREPKDSEFPNYPMAKVWNIGKDSVAIAVHKDNPINDLTLLEIQRIFTVQTYGDPASHYWTTWDQLFDDLGITGYGSEWVGEPIWRIYRPLESGTHDAFNKFFLEVELGDGVKEVMPGETGWIDRQEEIEDNGVIYNRLYTVAGKFQISYFGAGFADYPAPASGDYVKGLEVDFGSGPVGPLFANVLDNTYPVSRNLYYVTRRMPSKYDITSDASNDYRASLTVAKWVAYALNNPSYTEAQGYLAKGDQTAYGLGTWRRADFTTLNSTGNKFKSGLPLPFNLNDGRTVNEYTHDPLPNGAMDGGDVLYLTNAWRRYFFDDTTLNPYCDIDGSGSMNGQDVLGFTARWREFFFP